MPVWFVVDLADYLLAVGEEPQGDDSDEDVYEISITAEHQ
jgi:hypothetical protein